MHDHGSREAQLDHSSACGLVSLSWEGYPIRKFRLVSIVSS